MRYEPAGPGTPTATGCQDGTKALGLALRAVYPELRSLTGPYGCWNPRRIEGSSTWSLHAEGRALDTGVPVHLHEMAWSVCCELVDRRTLYGTMRVLWDGHIWSTEKPADWRRLQPTTNQHRDHFHVEQFWRDALKPSGATFVTYRDALRAHRDSLPVPQ